MGTRINYDPVPDIHTHEFTLFALNDLEEKYVKLLKRQRKARTASSLKFFFVMTCIYYIYGKLNKRIDELEDKEETDNS